LDITSTSFGLGIAFLLPGLAGLYAGSFWIDGVAKMFRGFLTVQSSVGLFLLVLLAAVLVGLEVTVIRWIVFECWVCRSCRLSPADFKEPGRDSKLVAFRAAVEESYRYHQYWGGMTIVLPFVFAGWMRNEWSASWWKISLTCGAFLLVEITTTYAAIIAFRNYVARAKSIAKGA
jgi:hypothetical protein